MGGRKRALVFGLIAGVAAAVAGPSGARRAWADEAGDLVKRGVELRRRGDDAGALRLFEEAYAADHSPRALAQMGIAEQALGRWVAASEHLREALEAAKDPWIAKNRATIALALGRVDEHVGRLEILGGPTGAEVRVDGVRRGRLPLARPLATTTGSVAIELVAPGYLTIERTTSVRAGETTRESFDGVARAAPKAPPEPARDPVRGTAALGGASGGPPPLRPRLDAPEPAPEDTPSRRWPLVLGVGGVAAAALVFGVVEHLAWQKKVDAFEGMAGCGADEPGRGGAACGELYDAGHRAKVLALVGYGVAGALAATTVILFVKMTPAGGGDTGQQIGRQIACAVNPLAPAPGVGCTVRF